jgi:hypothetical protein
MFNLEQTDELVCVMQNFLSNVIASPHHVIAVFGVIFAAK